MCDICTKEILMARIPFEVSEEQKKEFETRIRSYENAYEEKIPSSKLLRGVTSLIATMDIFEFHSFLRVLKNAEHATEEYFYLSEKYEMEHTFDPVPHWDFYKRYQIMLEIESKRTSKRFVENAVQQDADRLEKAMVQRIKNETSLFVKQIEEHQKELEDEKE